MVIGFFPTTAFASDGGGTEAEMAAPASGIVPLSVEPVATWDQLVAAVADPNVTVIALQNDISMEDVITIAGGREITITSVDGNQFVLTQATANQRHFVIISSILRLHSVVLSGNASELANHGGVEVRNATGRLYMEDSEIRNNRADVGGGVELRASSGLRMVRGAISGNTAINNGGGVAMFGNGASFVLEDGDISGNMAGLNGDGGGVHLAAFTVFTMESGTISGNTARYGGGVLIADNGSFVLEGGTLYENTATTSGGGVRVWGSGASFAMHGGEIVENTATSSGGGVYVTAGAITMEGGTIRNNTATTNSGGGVNLFNGGRLTMYDGEIAGNSATNGGGVNIGTPLLQANSHGIFTMRGGAIYNNTAAANGGGIHIGGPLPNPGLNQSIFTMYGGTIDGNQAGGNGGGIWRILNAYTYLTINAGTISNNTATSGGGIFAQGQAYSDPLPTNSYPRITIAPDVVFSGNRALSGAFRWPSNALNVTEIQTTSATLFGHPINNYDINFRAGAEVDELTVRFETNLAHGSFVSPVEEPNEHVVTIDLDPDNMPFHVDPSDIPEVNPVDGFRFVGWRYIGQADDAPNLPPSLADVVLTDDITFIAQFEVRVTFVAGTGGTLTGETVVYLPVGTPLTAIPTPTPNAGFRFTGWSQSTPNTTAPINAPVTFTAQFQQIIISPPNVPVRFLWNYGRDGDPTFHLKSIPPGSRATPPTPPAREGYNFMGWYLEPATSNSKNFNNPVHGYLRLYARWVPVENGNGDSGFHKWFMQGIPEGTFLPDNDISRAEVAAMLARTLIPGFCPELPPPAGMPFPDVYPGEWFHGYVAWVYAYDIFHGFDDGTFGPRTPITREELAAVIVRASGVPILPAGEFPFTDAGQITGWARDYVYTAFRQGWMIGDEYNMFHPVRPIIRAETAAVFFRVLDRGATNMGSLTGVWDDLRLFPDVADPEVWHFFYVVEASHSHYFILENGVERWTSVTWPTVDDEIEDE